MSYIFEVQTFSAKKTHKTTLYYLLEKKNGGFAWPPWQSLQVEW